MAHTLFTYQVQLSQSNLVQILMIKPLFDSLRAVQNRYKKFFVTLNAEKSVDEILELIA